MSLLIIDGNNRLRKNFEKAGQNAIQILWNQSNRFTGTERVLWVWDAPNGSARRKALYPAYKGESNTPSDDFFRTKEWFQKLLTYSNAMQLCIPTYEADDVIASIVARSQQECRIDSNDADFLALVSDRVQVLRDPLPDTESHEVRLYKTLVGDVSDNIKGLKGFGTKSWPLLPPSKRDMLIKHFSGEAPLEDDVTADMVGFTASQLKNFLAMQEELKTYWNIVGFFDVSDELIAENIRYGIYNPAAFDAELRQNLLTTSQPVAGQIPTMAGI